MGSAAKILLIIAFTVAVIESAVVLDVEISAEPIKCTAGENVVINHVFWTIPPIKTMSTSIQIKEVDRLCLTKK